MSDTTTSSFIRSLKSVASCQSLRRGISTAISLVTILSLLLSSLPVGLLMPTPALADGLQQIEPLYRARVTLQYPYDATRLAELGLTLYDQTETSAVVFADQTQLETLARRGFRPSNIVEQATLRQLAGPRLSDNDLSLVAAPDSDNDGLTDQEEEWWCTDPNDANSDSPLPPSITNPSDGDEVEAILNGVTAYGPPFGLWPQFSPYTPNGDCPDGDFDGAPDYAEEFVIGTSPLRESSDKDKFDDGQELFGVTFCPAPSGPCGYGILPRAEDSAFVSANLPAWVLPPGDSPWVAAFPEPEVEIVPSSIKVAAVTTIQTERTISEGEEHTYGTAKTTGTSSSVADTVTWNEWQEVSETTELKTQSVVLNPQFKGVSSTKSLGEDLQFVGATMVTVGAACTVFTALACAPAGGLLAFGGGVLTLVGMAVDYSTGPTPELVSVQVDPVQENADTNHCLNLEGEIIHCNPSGIMMWPNGSEYTDITSVNLSNQDRTIANAGTKYEVVNNDQITSQPIYYGQWPTSEFIPTTTKAHGTERGGAKTTTHTEYEEQTISESSTNQFSESWSSATAIDTAHAADLRFSYNIVNNGTEYAREVTSLLFNIYIGDDPNPAYTYVAVGDTGQIALIENLFPGESLNYTSNPIALNLEEMRAIDEGAPIRIVMEDIAFGQDQVFYQDAFNGSMQVAMEDGFADGDETIDTYLIPVWDPSDTVQDVLKRYFPVVEDNNGDLVSITTPEFSSNPPIFYAHNLTSYDWWNIYFSEGIDYTGAIRTTLAQPNSSILIRIVSDRDFDGYNDRNEAKLGTDPDDPASHPYPELLAGYTTTCNGDDCTVLMSFLNTGNYDAYGVEAVMYSPDGLSDVTNNTIGGGGRAPSGAQVVLGTRILQPDLTGWTGGAEPYSSGYYLSDVDRTYTFTATTAGNIGSGSLVFNWSDDQGTSGTVDFGSSYQAPLPQPIAQGVQVGFQTGGINVGESFSVRALTPRDTFQYTITDPQALPPIIVVSYNDPQGNHRFILPGGAYPTGSQLTDLNTDLSPLSGLMLPDPGVTIAATGEGQAHFILNSPHPESIGDSHLFVEYIDSAGNVEREDVFTQTLETGPTIVPLTVDTGVYTPSEYILLAFFTDSQGNIIDSSARPLASFGADPLPVANLVAGQWEVGLQAVSVIPNPWDFGTVEAGTLLSARLTLANSGLASLQYSLNGLGNGLSLAGPSSGVLAPADSRSLSFALDTAGLPGGPFTRKVTLRTNDPNAAVVTINLAGSIQTGAGAALAHQVNPFRPWDQYVSVPGPRNVNEAITFTHTISDAAARMHPLYLYTEDGATLKGVGEFGVDFTGQTASFGIFGTGADGDLLVGAGQTIYVDDFRRALSATSLGGQNTVSVADTSGFNTGDEVLVIQMQGTDIGNYEYDYIASTSSGNLTLQNSLAYTYTCDAKSRVSSCYN